MLLSATVNGEAVNVVAAPDSAQFLLNISASGKSATTRLAAHPGAVFLADFDPGALETLLALAVTQNNRDLWAILPKEAGSIEPVQLATYPDQEGTLDGKAVTVHHLVATIAGADTELFSGPENQLLQAELPQEGFALIRKGFRSEAAGQTDCPDGWCGDRANCAGELRPTAQAGQTRKSAGRVQLSDNSESAKALGGGRGST